MTFDVFLVVLLLISSMHYLPFQHWVFRTLEFGKIQLTIIQFIVLIAIATQWQYLDNLNYILSFVLLVLCVHNLIILLPFTKFYPNESKTIKTNKKHVSFLSVNVYQFNKRYDLLIDLVRELNPDILQTIESNKDWEKALEAVEDMFEYSKKVSQENTYGIHFYTKLKTKSIKVNYLVADDLPSIEAELETPDGEAFKFFGVHPPPPSPTEEVTSIERDAEILALAKKITAIQIPAVVVGDFNNVAWSKSSILFKKTTQLLDPRIGRGFISTFHAKYLFFRFPIDLIFHSESVFIQNLKTGRAINSDHFPLYGEFVINNRPEIQNTDTSKPTKEEKEDIDEMIDKGQSAESQNRSEA